MTYSLLVRNTEDLVGAACRALDVELPDAKDRAERDRILNRLADSPDRSRREHLLSELPSWKHWVDTLEQAVRAAGFP